ncbi:uncharacterized protein UPF0051 [Halanaerobium sp. DL-01]|uniref:SufD family Fe-S cluster assembly protein n=1 Tax=Halanaerobium sp. DL-01 TaxID=1653064 RepID=UPI000DF17008|nr:SufD family Fe-S cluster assembly protein [Halanaerobium sp. DL-01]RCW88504.1 uncharacterized protein UPF0051 [Halanaerobium sp. DL-01]
MENILSAKKMIIFLLFIILITSSFFCSVQAVQKVTVQSPPIPAAVPFLWMEKEDKLNGVIDLELNISSDHSRGVALLAKNEVDSTQLQTLMARGLDEREASEIIIQGLLND